MERSTVRREGGLLVHRSAVFLYQIPSPSRRTIAFRIALWPFPHVSLLNLNASKRSAAPKHRNHAHLSTFQRERERAEE